jgi:hypothetical protein
MPQYKRKRPTRKERLEALKKERELALDDQIRRLLGCRWKSARTCFASAAASCMTAI